MAGSVTPTSSAGHAHASTQTNPELTFNPDHPKGADHYDIEAAQKCGIATVALWSGKFTDAVLQKAGAVAIYDDAEALLAAYDQSPLWRPVAGS